ncbi:uncharacterized protein EI90DRAFT_3115802 [Cantharellus anzutake]|uniref:uncharacterized protein n=1 Tax=Cantharellus anzutake TaxID=1750568 RepID=UPI0019065853|nr:uncharacterized protein EI90DRAFT_3115802 [Cantharellus anzutake]KAF8341980.1 hypothetical protein EI90DRAFT_3115802 [Cantharellus anzutake]
MPSAIALSSFGVPSPLVIPAIFPLITLDWAARFINSQYLQDLSPHSMLQSDLLAADVIDIG